MAPVSTYIKLEHLNKQKINTVLAKIDRIEILDKKIKEVKKNILVLWIGYFLQSLLSCYLGFYFLSYPL